MNEKRTQNQSHRRTPVHYGATVCATFMTLQPPQRLHHQGKRGVRCLVYDRTTSMLVIHRRRITDSRRFEMRSATRYNGMRPCPVVSSLRTTTNGRPHGRSTAGAMRQIADPAVLRLVVSCRFLPAYDRVLAAGYPLGRVHESSQEMSRRPRCFRRPSLSFDLTVICCSDSCSYTVYGVCVRIRRHAEVDRENISFVTRLCAWRATRLQLVLVVTQFI